MKKKFLFAVLALLVLAVCTSATVSYPIPGTGKAGAASKVYFIKSISPAALEKVYAALGRAPAGQDRVGVKVSTGEPPSSNYLRQDLIGSFVKSLKGTYIECDTAYGGQRSATAMHYQVAKDHGFEPIVLMDEKGDMSIPVKGGTRMKENIVGKAFPDYTFQVVLSHFKGHGMAGFGGALKNMSIGYGSGKNGKNLIHSGGGGKSWTRERPAFLEAMAEAAKSIVDYLGADNYIYINVMNHMSVDCDCNGTPAKPTCKDLGIAASLDPVALDKACLDLVWAAPDTKDLKQRIENRNGALTVYHAAEIGLGNLEYELIELK
ncbi:MAG: DUF362 domain-containing protein [Spirochaetaceae bacterium]|nr:DUF362 domain-containing protein [Spirochaetaceae bacterium]